MFDHCDGARNRASAVGFFDRDPALYLRVCRIDRTIATKSYVIPGRRAAANPESSLTYQRNLWGQSLQHHPHVHTIVPGGGVSADLSRWIAGRSHFFLPVKMLSALFRRLFLKELSSAHRAGRLKFFAESKTTTNGVGDVGTGAARFPV